MMKWKGKVNRIEQFLLLTMLVFVLPAVLIAGEIQETIRGRLKGSSNIQLQQGAPYSYSLDQVDRQIPESELKSVETLIEAERSEVGKKK